jgi:hypothetical protein
VLTAIGALAAAGDASAQAPQFINTTVETKTAASGLEREIESAGAARRAVWVGIRVTTIPVRQEWCSEGARPIRVALEPARSMLVLARLEAGALTDLRAVGDNCEVDGGGVPVLLLEGATADASANWLRGVLGRTSAGRQERRIAGRAMNALAWTDGRAAVDALIEVARRDTSQERRGKALFWLSQRAGQEAVAAISGAIDNDPDTEVKKKAVFALSQLPQDQGVPLLIQVARTHANRQVRRQAMFWLGQSRDARALSFFEDVLRR